MTGSPEPEPPLDLPGPLRIASVPLVAGALAAWIALSGGNPAVFRAINGWPARTGDALWANLSMLGDSAAVLALCAVFIGRRPRLLWSALVAGLGCMLVLQPLKRALGVARPLRTLGDVVHVIGPELSRNSFPSGHAVSAFAGAALACAVFRRGWARAAAVLLALIVATSRVAVGAHWPLDVLAGAALGWICASAGLHLAARWSFGMKPAGRVVSALLPLLGALALLLPDEHGSWILVQPVLGLGALLVGLPAFVRMCRSRPLV
jgi:membrane-associated phospholipid phosphatase